MMIIMIFHIGWRKISSQSVDNNRSFFLVMHFNLAIDSIRFKCKHQTSIIARYIMMLKMCAWRMNISDRINQWHNHFVYRSDYFYYINLKPLKINAEHDPEHNRYYMHDAIFQFTFLVSAESMGLDRINGEKNMRAKQMLSPQKMLNSFVKSII